MLFTTSHLLSVYLAFSHSSIGLPGFGQKLGGKQRCLAEKLSGILLCGPRAHWRERDNLQSQEQTCNLDLMEVQKNPQFGGIFGASADSAPALQVYLADKNLRSQVKISRVLLHNQHKCSLSLVWIVLVWTSQVCFSCSWIKISALPQSGHE